MSFSLDAERLQLALQGSDLVFWDVDQASGDVAVNPRGFEILGLSPDRDAFAGQAWSGLVHPEDRARVRAAVRAAFP